MRFGLRLVTGAIVLFAFFAGCSSSENKNAAGTAGGAGGTMATGGTAGAGGGGATDAGGGDAADGAVSQAPFCGDGVISGAEKCERRNGCQTGERCSATCTCTAGPPITPSSQELIENAYQAGKIDYPTSLLYRVWALFQAPDLPEAYDGAGSSGEDTVLFFELSRKLGKLPADVESKMKPYLVRPDDPTSI